MSLRGKWQRMHMVVLTYRAKMQESPALFEDGRELVNLVALFGMRNTEPHTNKKKLPSCTKDKDSAISGKEQLQFFCLFCFTARCLLGQGYKASSLD